MTDGQPKRTGLDDGPPLPAHVIRAWKKPRAIAMFQSGATLRQIGAALDISHETARVWCRGISRPRPHHQQTGEGIERWN